MSLTDHYSQTQISLHWAVLVLVVVQYFTGERMGEALEQVMENGGGWTGGAVVHGAIGVSILLAMLIRLAIRLDRGAPPPPESESSAIRTVSRGVHFAFYAVLIAMPFLGLFAVFRLNETAAEIHHYAWYVLLALVAAHVSGAIWHLTRGDGVVRRMYRTPPQQTR